MLKPISPVLESIDGDRYRLVSKFDVKFGYWLRVLQFDIPEGFETDIASIPFWFRSVIDRASLGLIAPIVHDFLCDKRGKVTLLSGEDLVVSWFDTNLLFLLLMRIDGVPWPRSLFAFLAVTIGSPKW